MALPQLFGVIPTGSSVIITPSSAPSQTSLVYNLPHRPFSHIAVFLLPGVTLPPETAAAVYLAFPSTNPTPNFKFLGGIGPGKESAIFKVNAAASNDPTTTSGEVDMDAPEESDAQKGGDLTLGISIESSTSVAQQMATLANKPPIPTINEPPNALVISRSGTQQPNTLLLAQRIIKNAFNFLASFSDSGGQVPLKAFENWWSKFEGRLRSDPGFLERDIN